MQGSYIHPINAALARHALPIEKVVRATPLARTDESGEACLAKAASKDE